MFNILLIGKMGEGKSSFIKKYIGTDRNCAVFDVQNEYVELSTDEKNNRYRNTTCEVKSFVSHCSNRMNSVCVFEEATGFFQGSIDSELRRLMISKRHTKNVNIFAFHSISSVPPRIVQLMDYVVLYKTSDEPYQVEKKFPSLYGAFLRLSNMPRHSNEIIKLS